MMKCALSQALFDGFLQACTSFLKSGFAPLCICISLVVALFFVVRFLFG